MAARKKRRTGTKQKTTAKATPGHSPGAAVKVQRRRPQGGKILLRAKSGHVLLISPSGVKKISRHGRKKASATEIMRSVGVSRSRQDSARQLIARLEKQGQITTL